jgi:putative membrane protein
MEYLYTKALHIIFVVTWFSGLFYLGRLLIYVREAQDQPEPARKLLSNQLLLMSKRLLYAITWPSAVLTWIFGLRMADLYGGWPSWLLIKLGLVFLLSLYHLSLDQMYRNFQQGKAGWSSFQLRLWNEVPTVFLIAIVMLVVVKQNISLVYGVLGLFAFVLVLFSAIRIYKAIRGKETRE